MMKTNRNSNIELLRIILSLLIVIWHIGVKVIQHNEIWSFNVLQPLLIAPVITFGIISGYFLRESNKVKWKEIIKTLLFFWVISTISTIIMASFGIIPWTRNDRDLAIDEYALGIILSGGAYWWYMFSFLVCSLIIPLINVGLNEKNSLKFEIILIVFLWLITSNINIWFTLSDSNGAQPGDFHSWKTSVTNYAKWTLSLINAYLIGGFLKTYGSKMFQYKYLVIYISIIVLFMIISSLENTKLFRSAKVFGRELFLDHSDLTTPITSVCLFGIFATIKIRNNKAINFLSSNTLSVYLLQFIIITIINWQDFRIVNNFEGDFWILSTLTCLTLFLVSFLLNYLKNILFKIKIRTKKN